jgi:hypothetical protein
VVHEHSARTAVARIDLAELRYGLAFGPSVEEMADFLRRDVDDVRHKVTVEAQRTRHTEVVR